MHAISTGPAHSAFTALLTCSIAVPVPGRPAALELADIDADLDVVLTSREREREFSNDGAGVFGIRCLDENTTGTIGIADLNAVLMHWLELVVSGTQGDIDGSGQVRHGGPEQRPRCVGAALRLSRWARQCRWEGSNLRPEGYESSALAS